MQNIINNVEPELDRIGSDWSMGFLNNLQAVQMEFEIIEAILAKRKDIVPDDDPQMKTYRKMEKYLNDHIDPQMVIELRQILLDGVKEMQN